MARKHHGRGIAARRESLTGWSKAALKAHAAPPNAGPVLLVGHAQDWLEQLGEALSEHGFKVFAASRMSDALAAVVKHRPAVVCFTNLLGYSGHLTSFIDNLPGGPTKKRAPVIILTAYPLNEAKLAEMVPGFIPGYDAYVQKPAVIADVLDCVRRTLRIA